MTDALQNALLAGTVVCVLANALEAVAKAMGARFVLRNSAEVGLERRWIPHLAVLEGAGVVGLVLGLLGAPLIGLAAAAGLVPFFVGAVLVHVRARVFHNIAFALVFLCLAVAALGHFAWSTS